MNIKNNGFQNFVLIVQPPDTDLMIRHHTTRRQDRTEVICKLNY